MIMKTMPKVSLRTKQFMQKRPEIINKAKKLLFANGYDRTTIRDISQACGCTVGNIYNYFSCKEEILYEVLLLEIKELIAVIEPLEDDETTSPVEQLRFLILRHMEHALSHVKTELPHFEMEMRHLSRPHQRKLIEFRDVYDRILRRIICRGIEAGVFAQVNEKLVNYAIAAVIIRARVWYSPKGELSISELSDAIFRLFLDGLEPRNNN